MRFVVKWEVEHYDADVKQYCDVPEDELVEKLLSNLEEVKSRGGTLYVFGNATSKIKIEKGKFMNMPDCGYYNAPIVYTIPLQILAYEVACSIGTDLDQPRNLAKSVTVE